MEKETEETGIGKEQKPMKNRKRADLVVFGRIFTAEDSQLAEAFAVKDGRFIYVGGRKGAEAFVEEGKTEVLDYTGQALTALTINCARQMFIEEERGSIREGKYADFLLVDRDVLSCPVDQIHTARPRATYFEGKKVFSR